MTLRNLMFFLLVALLVASCQKYTDETEPYDDGNEYVPLLMTYEEMTSAVKQMPARQVRKPGKLVLYNNYILVVEKYMGFHVINNTNPSAPVNTGFFSVPGCVDVAVKNDIVFADNAVDLVAVNIADKANMYIVNRIPSVFPELLPPGQDYIPHWFTAENRPVNTIIVGWKKKEELL